MSIHVVDVARGTVAEGLRVRVDRLDGDRRTLLAQGMIGATGVLDDPALTLVLPAGVYEIVFELGDYLRRVYPTGPVIRFLETTPFRFGLDDPQSHYHLPFKFTPWGFSCFRGA